MMPGAARPPRIKLTQAPRLLKGPRLTGLPAGMARAAAAMWER